MGNNTTKNQLFDYQDKITTIEQNCVREYNLETKKCERKMSLYDVGLGKLLHNMHQLRQHSDCLHNMIWLKNGNLLIINQLSKCITFITLSPLLDKFSCITIKYAPSKFTIYELNTTHSNPDKTSLLICRQHAGEWPSFMTNIVELTNNNTAYTILPGLPSTNTLQICTTIILPNEIILITITPENEHQILSSQDGRTYTPKYNNLLQFLTHCDPTTIKLIKNQHANNKNHFTCAGIELSKQYMLIFDSNATCWSLILYTTATASTAWTIVDFCPTSNGTELILLLKTPNHAAIEQALYNKRTNSWKLHKYKLLYSNPAFHAVSLYCTTNGKIILSGPTHYTSGSSFKRCIVDKNTLTPITNTTITDNCVNIHHDDYKSWVAKSVDYLMTMPSLKPMSEDVLKIVVAYVHVSQACEL